MNPDHPLVSGGRRDLSRPARTPGRRSSLATAFLAIQGITPLDDGRVVLTWGVGTDNKGIRYNVSTDDGQTWGVTRHVLKQNDVTARYGSPRTVQLGKNKIGTVYFNRFGLYLIRVTLN